MTAILRGSIRGIRAGSRARGAGEVSDSVSIENEHPPVHGATLLRRAPAVNLGLS